MNYKDIALTALRDRGYSALLVVLGLVTIIAAILMATQIQPVDLQVTNRYSSFGIAKFYRDKWYYLLSFVLSVVIVAIMNTLISLKLYDAKGGQLARFYVILSIITVIIGTVFMYGVLRVASLSQ